MFAYKRLVRLREVSVSGGLTVYLGKCKENGCCAWNFKLYRLEEENLDILVTHCRNCVRQFIGQHTAYISGIQAFTVMDYYAIIIKSSIPVI